MAATNLDGNFQANTDAYLRTPTIDLSDVTNATLMFDEYRQVDASLEFHHIAVSVLDAETEDEIVELARDAGQTDGWETRGFPLPPKALGEEVNIEFRLVTDEFNRLPGWYLDNVRIVEE